MDNDPALSVRTEFEATAPPLMRVVYNAALRLVRRPQDASDLVQETYLRAYRTFANFSQGTNCKAWLFTIMYSIFINRYRKERREPQSVSFDQWEERLDRSIATSSEQPDHRMVTEGVGGRWTSPEVENALKQLPEAFRSAVLLVDVEDLTYDEAAAVLHCPIGTLRSRLFRARQLLFEAALPRLGAVGAGYARYSESKLRADGSPNPGQRDTNTDAIQFGGGIDIGALRWLGFRLELRDLYTGARIFSIATPGARVHNVVGSGGLVLRF